MNKTELIRAFNGVDDEIIERCEKAAAGKVVSLRRRIVMAVAAVLIIAVLTGAAAVVRHWDSVQNWIAYSWENSTGEQLSEYQTGVIESYSQKIGVSQTVNGVTVTAESAMLIDGRLDVMLHVDGVDFPDEGRIDVDYYEVQMNSSLCGGTGFSEFGYDNGTLIIPLDAFCNVGDSERYVNVTVLLKDFIAFNTREVMNAGEWKLEFTLENENFDVIELPDTEIMANYHIADYSAPDAELIFGEMPVTITNVELTAMGISFEYEYEHGGVWDAELEVMVGYKVLTPTDQDNQAYAVLEDGSEVKEKRGNISGTPTDVTDPIRREICTLTWPAPINLDEVVEIHIGDTVIPVK